jgi:hypothetical protein
MDDQPIVQPTQSATPAPTEPYKPPKGPKKPGSNMLMLAVVVVILVIIIAGAAYYFLAYKATASTKSTTISSSAAASTSILANNSLTYSNREVGVSFDYPQTWNVINASTTNSSGQDILLYPLASNAIALNIYALPATNSTDNFTSGDLYSLALNLSLKYAINVQNTTISGYKAMKVEDQVGNSSSPQETQVIFYLINATSELHSYYVIEYESLNPQSYTTYLPQAQGIINSIKLSPVSSTYATTTVGGSSSAPIMFQSCNGLNLSIAASAQSSNASEQLPCTWTGGNLALNATGGQFTNANLSLVEIGDSGVPSWNFGYTCSWSLSQANFSAGNYYAKLKVGQFVSNSVACGAAEGKLS